MLVLKSILPVLEFMFNPTGKTDQLPPGVLPEPKLGAMGLALVQYVLGMMVKKASSKGLSVTEKGSASVQLPKLVTTQYIPDVVIFVLPKGVPGWPALSAAKLIVPKFCPDIFRACLNFIF